MDKDKFTVVPVYGKSNLNISNQNLMQHADELFDLSSLTLGGLMKSLKKSLDKKPSMFIFLRRRENDKISLTTEKINLLITQVTAIQSLHKNVLDMQADAIFSGELLNMLVNEKRQAFIMAFNEKVATHETYVHEKKYEIESRNMDLKEREHRMRMEELITMANASAIQAKTNEQAERAKLFKEAIDIIKLMPPILQSSTINSIFGKSTIDPADFSYDEDIREFVKKMKEEEWKKSKNENEFEEWKMKRKKGEL